MNYKVNIEKNEKSININFNSSKKGKINIDFFEGKNVNFSNDEIVDKLTHLATEIIGYGKNEIYDEEKWNSYKNESSVLLKFVVEFMEIFIENFLDEIETQEKNADNEINKVEKNTESNLERYVNEKK